MATSTTSGNPAGTLAGTLDPDLTPTCYTTTVEGIGLVIEQLDLTSFRLYGEHRNLLGRWGIHGISGTTRYTATFPTADAAIHAAPAFARLLADLDRAKQRVVGLEAELRAFPQTPADPEDPEDPADPEDPDADGEAF